MEEPTHISPPSTASTMSTIANNNEYIEKSARPSTEAPQELTTITTTQQDSEKKNTEETAIVQLPSNDSEAQREEEEVEDESIYPTGLKLGLISLSLCLVVFLLALDGTIIATAIPRITDQFHSLDDVGWYGSSYMLTMCSFQLVFGRMYTFFDTKIIFLVAVAIFELGSLLCGIAPSSTALIVGRAVAGLGCAGILSGAMLILASCVPLRKRPIFNGLIGGMYGIASVLGPLMGGAFTDHATWRWCFYINLPIGAVSFAVIFFTFQSPAKTDEKLQAMTWQQKLKLFDWYGTALLMPCVICLLLALQWGGSTYAWTNWRIIMCLVLFGVLAACFTLAQFLQGERATLPIRIINQRSMACATFSSFAIGSAFMLLVYFVPIWFQAIKGVTATKSGIMNLPLVLMVVVGTLGGGVLVTVIGYATPFMVAGGALTALGAGLLTTFSVHTPHSQWIAYQAIAGFGIGLSLSLPQIVAQIVLKAADIPTGLAVVIFAQSLGGALFISIGQNIFTNKLVTGVAAVTPDISATTVISAGATGLKAIISAADYPKILVAYNSALTTCYIPAIAMGAIACIVSCGIEFKSIKGKKVEATL